MSEKQSRSAGTVTSVLPSAEAPHRAEAAHRAEALLIATSRFVRCDDVDSLAAAVLDALASIFGSTKSAIVLTDEDGSLRLEATRGYSAADLELTSAAVRDVTPFVLPVAAGDEVWSDDDRDDALHDQLAAYGSMASFSLPIVTGTGVAGNITGMFETEPQFDDGMRSAARHLASQVGLAVEVIDTRIRLRREAEEAGRERRQAAVLLQVAHELATVTEPAEIPPILAAAIRKASNAAFAAIARVPPEGSGLEVVAGDGLTPAQETLFQQGSSGSSPFPLVADLLAGNATPEPTGDDPSDAPGAGVDSFAVAPIVIDGQAWGIVGLGANDELALANDWWVELAQGFASIAATALARAEAVAALARQRDVLAADVAERTLRLTAAVEELQRASDAKTAFLGTVSHELRTPLTAILGFVEILDTGMDGPLNQAQSEDIRTVQTSSRHLLELIDDLIDVSSIEAGQIQLSRASVAIEELVRESIETMRPMAGEKGISLEADRVEALLADGDRGRLREIILNLLSNALKFTPSGGRIRVSAIADAATGDLPAMARIDVRDSGIGIAGADSERIFETFVRAAGPSYEGTGLGLTISRELARLHGGDLTVESTLGIGSTFSVHVPLVAPVGASEGAGSSR